MKKVVLLLFLFFFGSINSFCQDVWVEKVYSPIIKTVKLEVEGVDFLLPMLRLGTNDKIVLKFDELSEGYTQYGYSIIHCNSDWTKSELQPQEYIEGFEQGIIENHLNSINTIQRFTHYFQDFPSQMMRFLVSGNYVIKVFEDDNPNKVIMVRRFMVYEQEANIRANVMMARAPDSQKSKQELDVFVSPSSNVSFADPNRYLKVLVQQNGRRDNISQLKLRQYRANELEYSFDNSNIFDAGNEFRNFDFTSMRVRSQTVSNFDYVNGNNIVRLRPVVNRSRLAYTTIGDIDGYYYIRNDRGDDYDLESDYAWIDFYLNTPMDLYGGYYVFGELTDWNYNQQNKMEYNANLNAYTLSLYLKQGFYNYMIMYNPANTYTYETSKMEGNYSETNNSYHIFVYYRKPGNYYDSLIGYYKLTANG
ncbi:MAG TPA: DUF5103 domain-containing protein [Bacteroidales bacterium]|nr:DUF5103 domain-containing protein [Bacteroidales bacterium]